MIATAFLRIPFPRLRLGQTFIAPLLCALGLALATPLVAQDTRPPAASETPAALFADSVRFDGDYLTAQGDVIVLHQGARLTATQIRYAHRTGSLEITGPIQLTQADGRIAILASMAELDSTLKNGIMRSARLVIDRQLQLASAQLDLVDGRYTRLTNTVASACEVCANRPVPLWEIRAREVIHDAQTRQVFFNSAQFRLAGVPVFWLPRLRMPDPSLERATGFLIPRLRNDTLLGTGIELPYFIALGDHRDITLTPYIGSRTKSLGLRYRQAYHNGRLTFAGALSRDETRDGTRGYAFVSGAWDVGRDLNFGIDLRATSDTAYLLDYDVFTGDRLPSRVTLNRFSSGEALDVEILHIRSLRDAEIAIEDQLPFLLGSWFYERALDSVLPGQLFVGYSVAGSYRASDDDLLGYDVLRLSSHADWQNSYIFGPGLRLDNQARLDLDGYLTRQDSSVDDQLMRATPAVQTRLSWPLTRTTQTGARQVLEPFAQIGWSETYGGDIPNIDSTLVEFDEGNIFSLSRFPGADRRAQGVVGAAGLRFSHETGNARLSVLLGRLAMQDSSLDFTAASGLEGLQSDWLVSATATWQTGLSFNTRALFDDTLSPTKLETRLDLIKPRYSLSAYHSYVIADSAENRTDAINELGLDGAIKLSDNWTANAETIYDFETDEATRAGLGLTFENECARVELGVSRRFTDSDAVDPSTRYSFAVGFGAFGQDKTQGQCGF